jgi:polyhydroxybutyrate depolymerase
MALPVACVATTETAVSSFPPSVRTHPPQTAETLPPHTANIRTLPSAGNSSPQSANTRFPRAGQSLNISLSTEGKTRDAWVHIPNGYSSAAAAPLILNFHGSGSSGKEQEALSAMSALADREGFLVAYPNGINQEWVTDPGIAGAADRQFIKDLVGKLQADYRVDPKRIYATGMSNGGGMANRAGCALADIFAAISPVEGGYKNWDDCTPSRPLPVMAFHGITDPVVPFKGGEGKGPAAGNIFPSIPEWSAAWAKRDLCSATPDVTHPNAEVTRQEWAQCAGGSSVILYAIDHQGHSWPGSKLHPAITSQAIDASAEMWRFFQAHPMP